MTVKIINELDKTVTIGAISATIPFQQLGSVIDAIILQLPMEKPTRVEGSPIDCAATTPTASPS